MFFVNPARALDEFEERELVEIVEFLKGHEKSEGRV